MPITATVRSTTDSLRLNTLVNDRHWVVTDEPPALGGDDSAPTPYELLAAALAACVVTTIRMYARRKGWELDDVGVDAVFGGDPRDPRCSFTVHLPDDLDDERRERLERVAQACAVHRALAHGVTFEHESTPAVAA